VKIWFRLGTDISGGYSCSLLNAIRNAVITSKVVEMNRKNGKSENLQIKNGKTENSTHDLQDVVDYKEAFWLATVGGASVLGISDKIGNFEVGKAFDALLIDYIFNDTNNEKIEDKFQRFINLGDDRNILQVYVQGRCVVDNVHGFKKANL